MNSLLRCAYIERYCNVCGKTFRVTLLEILMEHRVHKEWDAPRHCSVCSLENRQIMWAIPENLIEDLDQAWQKVAEAAGKAGVNLQVNAWETPGQPDTANATVP